MKKKTAAKVLSPSFFIHALKSKVFFASVLFTLLFIDQTSFAQTVSGCMVGDNVYPTHLGIRKQYGGCAARYGCEVYGGTPTAIDRTCDAVFDVSGYCFAQGRQGNNAKVTKIQCPLDSNIWVLMFATAAIAVFYFKKSDNKQQPTTIEPAI